MGRGRRLSVEERRVVLQLIDEWVRNGARLRRAYEVLGISVRTVQRWRTKPPNQALQRIPGSCRLGFAEEPC